MGLFDDHCRTPGTKLEFKYVVSPTRQDLEVRKRATLGAASSALNDRQRCRLGWFYRLDRKAAATADYLEPRHFGRSVFCQVHHAAPGYCSDNKHQILS